MDWCLLQQDIADHEQLAKKACVAHGEYMDEYETAKAKLAPVTLARINELLTTGQIKERELDTR